MCSLPACSFSLCPASRVGINRFIPEAQNKVFLHKNPESNRLQGAFAAESLLCARPWHMAMLPELGALLWAAFAHMAASPGSSKSCSGFGTQNSTRNLKEWLGQDWMWRAGQAGELSAIHPSLLSSC